MSNKELKSLLELCKKYGVKRVKTDAIELELSEDTLASHAIDKALISDIGPIKTDGPTEEEILFWSSGGVNP